MVYWVAPIAGDNVAHATSDRLYITALCGRFTSTYRTARSTDTQCDECLRKVDLEPARWNLFSSPES
jgi:hypothetical protein